MRRSSKLACICALFLLAVPFSAYASSHDSFSNVSLVGTSGTVSGSFTFNSSNDTFSNLSLSFAGGAFNHDQASNGGGRAICAQGLCGYTWKTRLADGSWVSDTIILNLKTGQYRDFGGIYNGRNGGDFKYMSVPEGGTELTYLLLSAFAILAGILISGKRHRAVCAAQIS
jgi:hypothetical protein